MRLALIASGGTPPIPATDIQLDRHLTQEVQTQLGLAGILDPPADGVFGPASQWALAEFLGRAGAGDDGRLDNHGAAALLEAGTKRALPLDTSGGDLASRVVLAVLARGHWVSRHPDCLNIVYVEGMDPDGRPNANEPDVFNDLRLLIRVGTAGRPEIVGAWEGTTEPGRPHVMDPQNPDGAARLAFGQYKAWAVGIHRAGSPSAHEALVQVAPVSVHRDLNKDFSRVGDAVFQGLFGINQHHGFDHAKNAVGKASAGCLVGRTRRGHEEFMALVKKDARFVQNRAYRFISTVLAAKDVA